MHLTGADQNQMSMSCSISTLLTRNLHEVFGENDSARRRAAIDEIFTEDCVFYYPQSGARRWRDEIDRVAGAIEATHLTFDITQLPSPRSWAMPSGYDGYRADAVRLRLTPGQISSLPATGGLRLSISFSTSYPDLGFQGRIPIGRTRQLERGRKEVQ